MDTCGIEYEKTVLNLTMNDFLGQHYNMESWIMNFWGNIV